MKKCGYCGHNNEDSAVRCSGCGKVLEARPAVKGAGDLKDAGLAPVIVGTFENTEHAGVLKAELAAAGIEAWIPEEYSIEFPPQTVTVQVAAKDSMAAGDIAADFHEKKGIPFRKTQQAEDEETVVGAAPGSIPNRRVCVSCGAPVPYEATLCPKCGWTQPQLG